MPKKFGLGKGLGALIPEEKENNSSSFKIDINLIKANQEQPRKSFDEEKIMQLAESIREHGIIQPLVLSKNGAVYNIIAGERRWRAAKIIGLKEVPCVILNLSDKEILEVSLIENIQREDLNPIEEALAYKKLIEDFKLKQEQLSTRIGKSRTAISNCMRLLNLDDRVQQYLIEGIITEGHGRSLLGVSDKDIQYKLAQTIIDEELSVRQTEVLIKTLNKKNKNDKSNENISNKNNPYYNDIQLKLQHLFNTKVTLKSNHNNKGKIQIEYYSEEELERILDILKISSVS